MSTQTPSVSLPLSRPLAQSFTQHQDAGSIGFPELWQTTILRILNLDPIRRLIVILVVLWLLSTVTYFVALLLYRCSRRREDMWFTVAKHEITQAYSGFTVQTGLRSAMLNPLRRSSINKRVRWADNVLELEGDAGDIGTLNRNPSLAGTELHLHCCTTGTAPFASLSCSTLLFSNTHLRHRRHPHIKLFKLESKDIEASPGIQLGGRKRDASLAGLDSSPGSVESPEQHHSGLLHDLSARKKAVKRACNECRQQKLKCDVGQSSNNNNAPLQICSRCKRLRLECRIDDNFKRIGKRSRNAEMEREIIELRKKVAAQNGGASSSHLNIPQNGAGSYTHDAVAGLLDLRNSPNIKAAYKKLEDVSLTKDQVEELFKRFFTFNHPFLPFLNAERSPEEYFQRSSLLFWTICFIGARHHSREPQLFSALCGPLSRLVWTTLADVPQNYHIVKALILLCAWPIATSSTSSDSTFMLCGMMMQIALQIGLHRPDHAQDFTKFRVEVRQAELQDRVVVWSVCNIVAQRIATAYGQPALTIYDWTLGPKPIESNPSYELPPLIWNRLLIEKFVSKVSKVIYSNPRDPVGLPDDDTRAQLVRVLSNDFEELSDKLRNDESPITSIYLKAAALHLHLSIFFSHRDLPSYRIDMLNLYNATTAFLETCLSLESATSVTMTSTYSHGLSLSHGTNYIFHMMLAAGFSLLQLMHHFLGQHELDTQGATELLTRTVWALRSTSVTENDLPERLAEVLAQVWKSGPRRALQREDGTITDEDEDSLQLKVRCRMSMSLVFDSIWRWRRGWKDMRPPPARYFNVNSGADAQPTSVENPSPTANTVGLARGQTMAPSAPIVPGMAGMATGIADDYSTDYSQANYEVFDPLNWMLDGIVDFPYSFSNVNPLDPNQNGIGVLGTDGL